MLPNSQKTNNINTAAPTLHNSNKPVNPNDERLDNEFQVYAPDVIRMKLVREWGDVEKRETDFKPEYLNQIFGEDEAIIGFKNLHMDIFFKADTLDMYMAQKYDESLRMRQSQDDYDPLDRFLKKPVEWDEDHQSAVYWPVDRDLNSFRQKIENAPPYTPPGEELSGYTVNDREFAVYHVPCLAKDTKAIELARRFQFLALLYIDALSYIDHDDPKWSVFLLFEKYKSPGQTKFAFAGFTTVYSFYGHPNKTRLRVSQVLVLPPFQRQGHGSRMLQTIYSYSRKHMANECCDVTVEDPSVEFQTVRDRLDFRDFSNLMERLLKNSQRPEWLKTEGPLLVWSREFWRGVHDTLKIDRDQVQRSFELWNYNAITRNPDVGEEQKKQLLNAYRLRFKRRLYALYKMKTNFPDAEVRKQKLQEQWEHSSAEYDEFLEGYQRFVQRA